MVARVVWAQATTLTSCAPWACHARTSCPGPDQLAKNQQHINDASTPLINTHQPSASNEHAPFNHDNTHRLTAPSPTRDTLAQAHKHCRSPRTQQLEAATIDRHAPPIGPPALCASGLPKRASDRLFPDAHRPPSHHRVRGRTYTTAHIRVGHKASAKLNFHKHLPRQHAVPAPTHSSLRPAHRPERWSQSVWLWPIGRVRSPHEPVGRQR